MKSIYSTGKQLSQTSQTIKTKRRSASANYALLFLFLLFLSLSSCEKVDNKRIPAVGVNVELNNTGLWDTYGVHGYGQYRYFIKSQRIPGNFAYSVSSYTGFGGVLLISGYNSLTGDYNSPLAYDLSCPVEAKSNITVSIDSNTFEAVCPACGSHYNVCEGSGAPVSGKALEYKYGMQRYQVIPQGLGGYTIVR